MNDQDVILEMLKVIVESETKRNILFEKALKIFLGVAVGITLILSICQIILIKSLFVG